MDRTSLPVSPRRLAAGMPSEPADAARSTGPRAAPHARPHGFTAARFSTILLEDVDSLDNFKADLLDLYQPVDSQELFAVERIALAQFSLLRCAALEAGFFTTFINHSINSDGSSCCVYDDDITREPGVRQAQVRSYCLSDGFQRQAGRSTGWTLFLRYQAQSERLYRRAIEEFERLRALRGELPKQIPIEPIPGPDPAEIKPVPPPETNPSQPSSSPPEVPPASGESCPAPSPPGRALSPRVPPRPRAPRNPQLYSRGRRITCAHHVSLGPVCRSVILRE